ncbi:MAG TPA: tripartite tricarboxylate transporter substrate binding protein [Chloroflexota bacterium]|nr:tripartite tricarboxylate transporter substrate binding protein [Chloroflexota bacterium]
MKRILVSLVAVLAVVSVVGCSQAAPAATPTKAAAPAAQATAAPAAAAQPTTAPAAAAQPTAAAKVNWPEKGKTVTIIVPVAAGGGSDVSTRVLQPSLEKTLGTNIEVINKAGANQQLGHTEFSKAKPDGYTLAMTNLPTTFTNYLDADKKAVYNRSTFVPVAAPVLDPGIICVTKDSPYKTMKDLVEAAKKDPGKISIGATGIMTAPHLMLLQAEKITGAKFNIVQFDKGAADATNALLGGHINGQSGFIGDLFTQVKSGNIRALAVMDTERSPFLKDIPTMKELGYDLVYYTARGYSIQKGTPQGVVDVLENAFKVASSDPDVKKKQDEMGLTQKYIGSKEYGALWDKMEKDAKPLIDEIRSAK